MTPDLEADLNASQAVKERVRSDSVFAQNLYASLCNVEWVKEGKPWSCSWRYAGGVVADLEAVGGDYLDYYCSGIASAEGLVEEGTVSDIVRGELLELGWEPLPAYDGVALML